MSRPFLQLGLEVGKRRCLALGVLVDPPVVDQPDRYGIKEVQLLPAQPPRDDEARVFEDAEVLHDAEAGHIQLGLELGERAAVTREEPVEQEASRWVSQCLEYAVVVVGHRSTIRDHIVTYQALAGRPGRARSASQRAP